MKLVLPKCTRNWQLLSIPDHAIVCTDTTRSTCTDCLWLPCGLYLVINAQIWLQKIAKILQQAS